MTLDLSGAGLQPRRRRFAALKALHHIWIVAVLAGVSLAPASPVAQHSSAVEPRPKRIVSLVPAVTEMIYAMGDGARVAAVSNYDHFPDDVARLPRVGGLLDPSVERILAIKPDLVIVYATQKDLIERLDRAAIPYFNYQHKALLPS